MGLCGTAQTVIRFPSNIGIEMVQGDVHAVIKVMKQHISEHRQLLSGDTMDSLCQCWGFAHVSCHKEKLLDFKS